MYRLCALRVVLDYRNIKELYFNCGDLMVSNKISKRNEFVTF